MLRVCDPPAVRARAARHPAGRRRLCDNAAVRVFGWLFTLVIVLLAAVSLDPDVLGRVNPDWADLTTVYPVSQLIALRPLLAVMFAVLALVFLVVALYRRIRIGRGVKTSVIGVVLLAVAAGHAWVIYDRGVDNPGTLQADAGIRPGDRGTGEITVLSFNTQGGATTAEDLVDVMRAGVDVAILPETTAQQADALVALLNADGASFVQHTVAVDELAQSSTAVLLERTLGEYVPVEGPPTLTAGSVRLEPATGTGPVLVGTHVTAPVAAQTAEWRADLEQVAELCRTRMPAGLILAGDLNATLDHAPLADLGTCASASVEGEVAGIATWPTSTPELLGSAIDHVLYDAAAYELVQAAVVEAGGSDHRGLLVRLRPLGG